MAEYTATTYMNPAKEVHTGVNCVAVSYNFGAVSASAGDVVLLAKIPHGARIVDFWEDHSTGATAHAVSFGLKTGGPGGTATYSLLISAGAQATKNRLSIMGIPPNVSVSDADSNRFGILCAKVAESGTATTSLIINAVCFYVTDGVT